MAYLKLSEKPKCFLDCETTGLNPEIHEMLEFAAIKAIADGDATLVLKIRPEHIETAEPKALEINGYNEAEWADAMDLREAGPIILAFLKNTVIIGHGVGFDIGFIEALLKKAGCYERVSYHTIDTCSIAYFLCVPEGLESLSLKNVCPFLGVPSEPTMHRALAGATACKAIYEFLESQLFGD